MNNKNTNSDNKQTSKSSFSKFKKVKIKGPIKILSNLLSTFKKKNAFNSRSFWIRNIIFFFFTFKLIQIYRYAREFDVTLTKEEAQSDLIYLSSKSLKNMNQEALFEYLDNLEKQKEKRNSSKQKFEKNEKNENFENSNRKAEINKNSNL